MTWWQMPWRPTSKNRSIPKVRANARPHPGVGISHGRGGHGMIEDDRDAPGVGDLQRFDPAGELQVNENVHVDPADDRVAGLDLLSSRGSRQDLSIMVMPMSVTGLGHWPMRHCLRQRAADLRPGCLRPAAVRTPAALPSSLPR